MGIHLKRTGLTSSHEEADHITLQQYEGEKVRSISIDTCVILLPHVYVLGHILCNSGKDDKDIMRQCQQLYARGNVLLRKFHMCSMSVKIQLFNTYCSPMYTAQLWWNHTVASFHRLNVAYNNVLRRLLRRPRFCSASGLFAECRIPNCKAVIRNLIFRFMTRLDLSTNSIISIILVSDIRWTSRIRRHWIKSLYVHHNIV